MRMGAPNSPHEDITENIFFNEIDWKKLERRMLEPPFKPQVVRSNTLPSRFLFAANKVMTTII